MFKNFFGFKDHLKHNVGYCKIYDTKYNNTPCSKITLKQGSPTEYNILLEFKHPNLFNIYKISVHSIYTQKLHPLSLYIDSTKTEYNRYIISKIKDAVEYIHKTFKKEHCCIDLESLFVEDSGKVILGNFQHFREYKDGSIDNKMLDLLCKNFTNKKVEDLDLSPTIFDTLFDSKFTSLPMEHEIALNNVLTNIINEKLNIPEITMIYIFKIFSDALNNKLPKENKSLILDFLFRLDRDYFIKNIKIFFSIMDTNVRIFLLNKFENSETNLDEIAENLSLGLKIKDKDLKKLTIDFIFNNSTKFNSKSFENLLLTMISCSDSDSIGQICTYLLNMKREDVNKGVFKLLNSYLNYDKNTLLVFKCVDKYFATFELVKITQIILPQLCEKLVDKNNQEYCFGLVEKIIKFLKDNREGINSKEWSLKGLKNIFVKSENTDLVVNNANKNDNKELEEWN